MTERWRPVDGWPYEVSDHGQVRRATAAPGTHVGRVLKIHHDPRGYPQVRLSDRERSGFVRVHRLVAAAFLGEPPEDRPHVNHKSGIKTDNRPENLEWSNFDLNNAHAGATGLLPRGEDHHNTDLTEADVIEMRAMYRGGKPASAAARRFGVSVGTATQIIRGKRWGHVAPETIVHRRERRCNRPSNVTRCPRGHPYTPENTRIHRRGWRSCRTCARERDRGRKR